MSRSGAAKPIHGRARPHGKREKGDSPHLCEAPGTDRRLVGRAPTEGWSRQMGTVPFFGLFVWSGPVVRSIIRDRSAVATVTRLTKEPTMWKSAGCSLLALLAMGIAGCQSVAKPDVLHPGPAVVQQGRAQQFDPYPQAEAGGNIAGTRPPDYQEPVPELDRARWMLNANGRPCPPPGAPVAGYGSPGGAPGTPVVTPGPPVATPGVAPVATGPGSL